MLNVKKSQNAKNKKRRFVVFCLVFLMAASALVTVEILFRVFDGQKEEPSDAVNVATEDTKEEEVKEEEPKEEKPKEEKSKKEPEEELVEKTEASGGNCTTGFGELMLINPNFTVTTNWISSRKTQLISVSKTYGIKEGKSSNGDNLMDKTAAKHLNDMLEAYSKEYAGHAMVTRSCFRAKGTSCGRLCAKTGTSDHHTGLTCDLIDPAYGTDLDTSKYKAHIEWQWLRENSYKYGFIDRFPEAWAGGPMSKPINVDENGTTGLFETWHFRYVGVKAATEIATGKYNNGKYDSLEHYLKQIGKVKDLKNGKCN